MSLEKIFATNVKKLRLREKMTQRDLGDITGYSDKTVSKWETGGCLPSVDALLRISTALKTDISTLLCDSEKTYYLGIDGGGTKTDLVLTDGDGNILREKQAEQCNPFDIGFENATRVLKDAIYGICEDIPLSSVVMFAGIAGTIAGNYKKMFGSFFEGLHFKSYSFGSDNDNIIRAGLGKDDGVSIIMGTGICVFAVADNERHRISGWGYLFDEGGSAYNIGRDGLSAYFSCLDGSGEYTSLLERIDQKEPSSQQLLTALYSGGKKLIASYAPIVFEEAENGDKICCGIIERNISVAAQLIRTAVSRVGKPCRCVVAGGLSHRVAKRLNELLEGTATVEVLSVKPVMGAIEIAKELEQ